MIKQAPASSSASSSVPPLPCGASADEAEDRAAKVLLSSVLLSLKHQQHPRGLHGNSNSNSNSNNNGDDNVVEKKTTTAVVADEEVFGGGSITGTGGSLSGENTSSSSDCCNNKVRPNGDDDHLPSSLIAQQQQQEQQQQEEQQQRPLDSNTNDSSTRTSRTIISPPKLNNPSLYYNCDEARKKILAMTSKERIFKKALHNVNNDNCEKKKPPSSPQPPSSPPSRKGKGNRGGSEVRFPKTLHRMLQDAEENNFDDIVGWRPHGRAFMVHDKARFVKEVLPRYFKQSKYTSFTRQLVTYGFQRIKRKGPDKRSYYHSMCLRNEKELCSKITKVNSRNVFTPIELEPNFYSMTSKESSNVGAVHQHQEKNQQQRDHNKSNDQRPKESSLLRRRQSGPDLDPSRTDQLVSNNNNGYSQFQQLSLLLDENGKDANNLMAKYRENTYHRGSQLQRSFAVQCTAEKMNTLAMLQNLQDQQRDCLLLHGRRQQQLQEQQMLMTGMPPAHGGYLHSQGNQEQFQKELLLLEQQQQRELRLLEQQQLLPSPLLQQPGAARIGSNGATSDFLRKRAEGIAATAAAAGSLTAATRTDQLNSIYNSGMI